MWQWRWTFWSTRGARRLDEPAGRRLTGCSMLRRARRPATNGLSVPVPAQTVVEAVFEGTGDCVGVPFRAHFRYLGAIAARFNRPNATSSRFRAQNGWRAAGGRCRPAGGGRRQAAGRWRLAGGGWRQAGGGRVGAGGWRVAAGGWQLPAPLNRTSMPSPGPAGNRLFGRQLLASSG